MRSSSPRTRSESAISGFTLLEVTIAMTFVAVLITGITLTINTCLKVWDRSRETADFNQEARAVIEIVSRDVRGAYLGLHRQGGYFVAAGADQEQQTAPTLEFTTESTTLVRAALLPEATQEQPAEEPGPPATDFVAVRYELLDETQADRPGLYRTTWLAPSAAWLEEPPPVDEAVGIELISPLISYLKLRYWDGGAWTDSWASSADNLRLPGAVALELGLLDARGNEHILESVILVPAH